ncbi:MAG: hypothetical protein LBH80_04640 [Prevotellaceae bacterium]|jgi:hypothetical protein|nr:hypothetical protein [Prevotellaceae bacterium]
MSKFKNIVESITGSEDFSDIKSSSLRDFLNGNIFIKKVIQKQYGLLIMLAVLAFFYIDNRYYCETQITKETRLKKNIEDAKYESLTISAELMTLSRRANVIKMLKDRNINLEESTTPPIIIE